VSPDDGGSFPAVCPAPARTNDVVLLGHGGGGRASHDLLERVFLRAFQHPALSARDDQAQLDLGGGRLAFTTDAFVVSPAVFPGGCLGSLAVHGTVNDLACSGATPLWLSAAWIIEEGTPLALLHRLVDGMRMAAEAAGVHVVTGDTKVVEKGKGDGVFVVTSGIGRLDPARPRLTAANGRAGDVLLVSGTLGDHGLAVLAARERLQIDGLSSDSAPLHTLARALLDAAPGARCLRDPTRGGLAASLVELSRAAGVAAEVEEAALPVSDAVRGASELLGLDPLHVANEGKLVAIVPAAEAEAALAAWRAHPLGRRAARVGELRAGRPGELSVRARAGGRRLVELPWIDPLPRIC